MCVLYGISVYNKLKAVSKMYLTVRKGFTALDVSAWYVCVQPGIFKQVLRIIL